MWKWTEWKAERIAKLEAQNELLEQTEKMHQRTAIMQTEIANQELVRRQNLESQVARIKQARNSLVGEWQRLIDSLERLGR